MACQESALLDLPRAGRDPAGIEARVAAAERMLACCSFCERDCRVDRARGELGWCGCATDSRAYFEGLLWAEELFITPSYGLFFAGCNLRCAFCYLHESNCRPHLYPLVDVQAVASRVRRCERQPASFSLIGGEPTVHVHTALRLIAALPSGLPVVWNSNFYFSQPAAELLAGAVEVFIADLHFGNNDCAQAIAGTPWYLEVVGRNLLWARDVGTLVVRHLVLPGHLDCCTRPALEWLASKLGDVPVHVLTTYLPPESAGCPELTRELSDSQARQALDMARALRLRMVQ